ncbi:MAG: transcription elongation factor GreA [Eubacteriales bacterium]
MANEVVLTHEGVEEIEKKLEYLKAVKRMEVAEQIKVARAFGDLSENAEYDEAKNEQARVEMEIATLEKMLKTATVIDEKSVSFDVVSVGTTVKVLDIEDKSEEEFYIVGSAEVDVAKNKISNESPVGRALLGHNAGDVVTVETPGGAMKYKILKIF